MNTDIMTIYNSVLKELPNTKPSDLNDDKIAVTVPV